MAVEGKRKQTESMEAFMRRFSKRMMESRVLINLKKRRFYEEPKSDAIRRASAIRRKKLSEEKEYLRKIGKLPLEFQGKSGKFFRPQKKGTASRISVRSNAK